MNHAHYLVCASHHWNKAIFEARAAKLPGKWRLITEKNELTTELLAAFEPRYAFFLHWSWIVPADILSSVEAICFHMTDLPYGRGGSPLQNLIQRGHATTQLSALRMTETLDGGPIYMKHALSLSGPAQAIYERASALAFDMIEQIIATNPEPYAQSGEPTLFTRRRPDQSRLPDSGTFSSIYDHIRMLDAEGYPHAFIEYGDLLIEFTDAETTTDGVAATVKISNRKVDD